MATLRYTSDGRARVRKTETGWILEGNFARTGVQHYPQADGTVLRAYRPPEEVFKPETLQAFEGLPVIRGHQKVTPENLERLSIGTVLRAEKSTEISTDGHDWTAGKLVVNRPAALEKLGTELVEVSVAYYQDFDPTPGVTPQGEAYDGVQRNIVPNHLGVGPEGWARAGRGARLMLDGNQELPDFPEFEAKKEKKKMAAIVLDGITCEQGSETHISLLQKSIDAANKLVADGNAKIEAITKDRERLDGELAAEKSKVVDLTGKLAAAQDPKFLEDGIKTELANRERFIKILGADFSFVADGKPVEKPELFKKAILKINPNFALKQDGGIDYLDGVLSTLEGSYKPVNYSKKGENNGGNKPETNDGNDDPHARINALTAKKYGHG